jgi:hypothetical protein
MLLAKDDLALIPRVRHLVGLPPELSGGEPQELMPPARLLVIKESHGQLFLFRYDEAGNFAGDTWHRNLEDAKHQVEFEYGPLVTDWEEVPPDVDDAVAFMLRGEA